MWSVGVVSWDGQWVGQLGWSVGWSVGCSVTRSGPAITCPVLVLSIGEYWSWLVGGVVSWLVNALFSPLTVGRPMP